MLYAVYEVNRQTGKEKLLINGLDEALANDHVERLRAVSEIWCSPVDEENGLPWGFDLIIKEDRYGEDI